ncbi:MAG TPA: cbb3-type cytochrome oxidase assembly protein CcoS [Planctomycetota bacterium]|nr:cbb3-type cytochrome oxidase assembly protein CcoS [Planctomycetota bacterium]
MKLLLVVLPIAALLVVGFLIAFAWAVRSGQLDDLDTPPLRILHDDDPPPPGPKSPS